jgi:4a-hydroxytetrahydrobiopterin dehydratase
MPLLDDDEIAERLRGRPGSVRATRSCGTSSSPTSPRRCASSNAVADEAAAANHHPDILMHGWHRVRLSLTNRAQGGLTDADFALAGRIDALAPG